MNAVLLAIACAALGYGGKALRYRLRLGVRCVRCGDHSWGLTLCMECEQVEREAGMALGSPGRQRAHLRSLKPSEPVQEGDPEPTLYPKRDLWRKDGVVMEMPPDAGPPPGGGWINIGSTYMQPRSNEVCNCHRVSPDDIGVHVAPCPLARPW